jgi:hypothetical protein
MIIMHIRLIAWSVGLCALSTGCGKTGVVRAPTRVVAEETVRPSVLVAHVGTEEQEVAGQAKAETPTAAAPEAFHFPADRGGELLSKQLTVTASRPLPDAEAQPRRVKIPARIESPELPLLPSLSAHVPLPERARKPLLPRMVTPETLVALALELALPDMQPMVVGERTKQPGADVNKPAPLPILGQPVPDRASLADATGDASGSAVIAATMPIRSRPVPFQRLSVPDPFENYRPLRLALPEEATEPVAGSPRTP